MKVLPMYLNLSVKQIGISFFLKVLIFTKEGIDLVQGSISYCDNQGFNVGEHRLFSVGEITVFQSDTVLLF